VFGNVREKAARWQAAFRPVATSCPNRLISRMRCLPQKVNSSLFELAGVFVRSITLPASS
jgi:hypothetical protein